MLRSCKQGSSWKLNRCNLRRKQIDQELLQSYQNKKKNFAKLKFKLKVTYSSKYATCFHFQSEKNISDMKCKLDLIHIISIKILPEMLPEINVTDNKIYLCKLHQI